jgi:EmrB/QacA subfamily drug resistance transporter
MSGDWLHFGQLRFGSRQECGSCKSPSSKDRILITLTTSRAATYFSRPRFALLVLLGTYPVITAILCCVFPPTEGWAIWQRSLLVAPMTVAIMVWGVIPAVQKLFRDFINPGIGEAGQPQTGSAERMPSAKWALAGLSLSMLLSSLGTSIANVGLPTLAQAFNASFQEVQWIVLAYLLAITTVIVSVGRLGDLIGRRRLLLAGILLFTVASVLCGVAPTLHLLIASRAAQGLGAAIMMALTMAFVGETVSKAKTGSAMGLLGTMSAVGTALGPSLGGVLIAGSGWPAIFLVNGPLGVLTLFLAYRFLPVDRRERKTDRPGFDHVGTLLLALALAAYALAMTTGRGSFGLLNAALLFAAVVGLGLFALVEAKAQSPLIPLAMFRNPVLSAGFAMSTLVTTVVMATLVVGPFYLSGALALDTAHVGLVMSSGPIVAALTGVPAGRIVDRFGAHRMTIAGLMGMAAGSSFLPMVPTKLGVPGYIAPLIVITAGYALFQAANNTAVMTSIRPEQRGVVSGLLNLSRNLGLITGASVMGTVFALGSSTTSMITTHPEAVATGMRITFAVAALLIFAALGIAVRRSSKP